MKPHPFAHGAAALLVAAAFATATPPALSQALPDPTRPPPSPAAAAKPGTAASAADPAPAAPKLQSLWLPRSGASSAMVDGRIVQVGDRIGGAEVVAIDARGLQLRGPRGADRIELLAATAANAAPAPAKPPPLPALPALAAAGGR